VAQQVSALMGQVPKHVPPQPSGAPHDLLVQLGVHTSHLLLLHTSPFAQPPQLSVPPQPLETDPHWPGSHVVVLHSHRPLSHHSLAPQTLLHPPQLFGSTAMLAQPLAQRTLPSQQPSSHEGVPSMGWQAFPQAPQLFMSELVLTHSPAHIVPRHWHWPLSQVNPLGHVSPQSNATPHWFWCCPQSWLPPGGVAQVVACESQPQTAQTSISERVVVPAP
jgi:hypothetical protein